MPRKIVALAAFALSASLAQAQTDVLVSHYDAGRTGTNLNETTLSGQNVNIGTFGKLYGLPVDGYVYAQPLYKSNVTIAGKGTFNVVFVATQHGSVYAFDAASATPLWHTSFTNPATGLTSRTTNPSLEDIVPEVSTTSTPVIDPASGTLYVIAETVQSGSPAYYWLRALDITSGADKVAPARIQASVGSGATPLRIDAATSQQRPGLVLSNGVIYVAFGSSGDNFPWVGWLLGYDAATLAQVTVFCTSASGAQGSGVWSSGEAPPVDANGNIFIATGNGAFNPASSDWGDSYLKLSTQGGLAVADYFTPFNQGALDSADLDLASAGFALLPDAAGSATHPHLLVGTDKDGELYLVDRDNMGHFNGSYNTPNSHAVQWIPNAVGGATTYPTGAAMSYVENSYTSPAYWQQRVYFCGIGDACKLFTLSNGLLATSPASRAGSTFAFPGAQPVVTAASSSAGTAIMWAIERDTINNVAVLHAYDATNLATELYNSQQAANQRDSAGPPVKFAVPTVANGQVFVGTQSEIDVYGLLASNPPRLAAPTFSPTPSTYSMAQSVTLNASSGATIYYTLDGTQPTLASAVYTAPIAVSTTTTINAIAVHSGSLTSPVASGTYTISPVAQIAYVQGNYATPQAAQASVAVKYTSAQRQGDLNVVVVGWNDSSATIKSVTDQSGNSYTLKVGPTVLSGVASQAIFYAANIAGAAANANTVTVAFNGSAVAADIRILEYSGLVAANPFDVGAAATGSSSPASSGVVTTTNANDLIIGADLTVQYTTGAGAGFTSRMITVPDGDIVEDRIVTATGSYAATAPISPPGPTIMQMAAFKAAGTGGGSRTPSAPLNLVATAPDSTSINLSWTAATESGGTIARYLIERCQGEGCSNFTQVGTSTTTTFVDMGLAAATTYSYRVRAQDNANNTGPYSNTWAASTAAGTPSAPANLTATAVGSGQINLSWGAATEPVSTINRYLIERCQGAGCSNFVQIGTSTTLSFADSGLAGSTSYSYRVRAEDGAGTPGPYSNVATASTAGSAPSAPTGLAGTASGSTQINLSWSAATESGGTIARYLIERCQGAGCSSFVQIGTSTTLSYGDTGLSGSSSYSYRVRAQDSANQTGPYSNTATASTAGGTPTAPTSLAAAAVGSVQINLSWGAATESGGTIARYLIERCQGAGCSSFVQIGTSTTLSYGDTGLSGSTSYSYRVRAQDSVGNSGPYSNVASATTAAPTLSAPTNLTATAAGSTQINLSWSAAGETGGTVSGYRIERCQGPGCATFAQIATAAGTTYNDAGLFASTAYSYRVRANDAAGNVGPYSNIAGATTASSGGSPPPITFVQQNYATPQSSQSSVRVAFSAAQTSGDLNVVVVGWNDSTATVGSVTDSSGNVYQLAIGPTVLSGVASQSIYYAYSIVGAAASANSVTVTFTSPAAYADIRVLEYSGIDTANPLDSAAGAAATGSSGMASSGAGATTYANDLILGADLTVQETTGAGSGFTPRVITAPDADIVEDRVVTSTGSYSASAPIGPAGQWIMQMVAFRRHP